MLSVILASAVLVALATAAPLAGPLVWAHLDRRQKRPRTLLASPGPSGQGD